ncbi:hypothetical protein KR200_000150, partial [Drosophila serrata]
YSIKTQLDGVKISNSSAEELIAHRHFEFETPSGGLKRTQNEGSAAELEELRRAQDCLRAQLSVPRIERLGGRALATWDEKQQVAQVMRKDGKFENFGYSDQGKLYLEYYEALFLLEVGRLQLEYYGCVVSIEQAYVLLLGKLESEKYEHYLIYSALSRAGYIVVRHQRTQIAPPAVTSEDCIWSFLKAKVGNQPVPDHIRESPHYALIEKRMEDFKELIVGQKTRGSTVSEESIDFEFDTRKRKAPEEPTNEPVTKRGKLCPTGQSLVNQLKTQPSYARFAELFQKFDIVQLRSKDCTTEESMNCPLKITFDLHLHNEGFKKSSPKAPAFNVIILAPRSVFPNHDQISKIQSLRTAPLLVVSVSESKQIQAFLYYIS